MARLDKIYQVSVKILGCVKSFERSKLTVIARSVATWQSRTVRFLSNRFYAKVQM
jgi:hypothetical protein